MEKVHCIQRPSTFEQAAQDVARILRLSDPSRPRPQSKQPSQPSLTKPAVPRVRRIPIRPARPSTASIYPTSIRVVAGRSLHNFSTRQNTITYSLPQPSPDSQSTRPSSPLPLLSDIFYSASSITLIFPQRFTPLR